MGVRWVVLLPLIASCDEHDIPQRTPPPAVHAPAPSILATNVDGPELKKMLDEFKRSQKDDPFNFAHLKKNARRYQGRSIAFSGKIVEIAETDNETTARIALNGDSSYILWVQSGFVTDFVEDDHVDVFGIVTGSKTYQSQAGWEITIPSMLATSIQKRGTFDRLTKKRRSDDE